MNTILKKYIIFAIASILMAGALRAQEEELDPNVDRLSIPFRNDSQKRLEANLLNGGITVVGYEGEEAIVEAKRRNFEKESVSNNGMRMIQLPSTGLFAEEFNNQIKVGSNALKATVDITIKVPFETSLSLNCVNKGDILIENITGEIEVQNVNGAITINNSSGAVLAHALNRDIVVTLNEVYPDKPMSFTSLNGDIDLTIPADTKAELKLQTFNGKIMSDFDIDVEARDKSPKITDGRPEGGRYRLEFEKAFYGSINGGGPQFIINTHNGVISIRKLTTE
ncbi:hypothetical protein VDG1235_1777 [Verrucomicrobiia bacterium DG1235]|nr:hypothetical protein VDG1235_1777 [Verrucomicrobiae bacterium DG1235]